MRLQGGHSASGGHLVAPGPQKDSTQGASSQCQGPEGQSIGLGARPKSGLRCSSKFLIFSWSKDSCLLLQHPGGNAIRLKMSGPGSGSFKPRILPKAPLARVQKRPVHSDRQTLRQLRCVSPGKGTGWQVHRTAHHIMEEAERTRPIRISTSRFPAAEPQAVTQR